MIVELRQYTLHPGQRDVLIELFTRELVVPQEDAGMRVLGTFRDLDRPDRFVWLRGFPDMPARKQALERFYDGPVWRAHRDAANATMVDSDNVLLLRPHSHSHSPGEFPDLPDLVTVTIYYDGQPSDETDALVRLETEPAENNFPRLPVRTGENVVVLLNAGHVTLPSGTAGRVERLRLAGTTLS